MIAARFWTAGLGGASTSWKYTYEDPMGKIFGLIVAVIVGLFLIAVSLIEVTIVSIFAAIRVVVELADTLVMRLADGWPSQ